SDDRRDPPIRIRSRPPSDLILNVVERVLHLAAEQQDDGDDDPGDRRYDEPVFDGSGALFVFPQLDRILEHRGISFGGLVRSFRCPNQTDHHRAPSGSPRRNRVRAMTLPSARADSSFRKFSPIRLGGSKRPRVGYPPTNAQPSPQRSDYQPVAASL